MNREQVMLELAKFLKINPENVKEDAQLTDLAGDSFILIEAVVEVQEFLNIMLIQDDLENVKTVGDFLNICETKLAQQS